MYSTEKFINWHDTGQINPLFLSEIMFPTDLYPKTFR